MVSTYRTVSEPAMMMTTGVIPVACFAKECKAIYSRNTPFPFLKGRDRQQLYADTGKLFLDNVVREMLEGAGR